MKQTAKNSGFKMKDCGLFHIPYSTFLVFLIALLLTSCNVRMERSRTTDHEPIVSADREVAAFERIQLMGSPTIYYTQGDTITVCVEAPQELVEFIETEVRDSTLFVKLRDDAQSFVKHIVFFNDDDVKVYVTSPDLVEVSLTGSGEFVSKKRIDTDNLLLTLRGSGDIKLSDVICDHLITSAVGSGDIDIDNLETQTSHIELVGSGDVEVSHVNVALIDILLKGSGDVKSFFKNCGDVSADLRGSGDISLSGNVRSIKQNTLGSGDFDTSGLVIGQ